MRRPGIRLRLTLLNTAVLLVILAIASVAVHLFVGGRLDANVRERLDEGFATLRTVIARSGGDLSDVSHLGHDALFRIVRGGEVVYRTEAWRRLRLDPLPWFEESYGEVALGDGRRFSLRRGEADPGLLIVYAVESTAAAESMRTLRLALVAGVPALVVVSLAAGFFLSGRALAPVAGLVRAARGISAERLDERLPVPDADDEIGRLAVVFNETLARLEDSFSRLKRFTADASHELRTPLTSIRSTGEVALREKAGEGSCREALGSILEETGRLTRLVDDLLVLARSDASGGRPAGGADLASITAEAAEELRVIAEENEQRLTVAAAGPVGVAGDPRGLAMAVANVLHNAIRYTPRGGAIDVRVSVSGAAAVLEVTDDGPGVPPEERERVFERFYRIDRERGGDTAGTGLGLAIARGAVERAGGGIAFVDTVTGRGARCRITLPLSPS